MPSSLPGYEEASELVKQRAALYAGIARRIESVSLAEAQGRILAEPLHADADQPEFPRSTRDGFACRAAEAMRREWLPIAGLTQAGQSHAAALPLASVWEIMTGAPVPIDADAVVMVEHVERDGDRVRLMPERKIASGENVVPRGAQARKGEQLLDAGSLLDAPQIALAATCGAATLPVWARPRVAILTTGDELVPIDAKPGPGQIRNSNAAMLAALVRAAGGEPQILPAAADTAAALDAALAAALHADMLLISGGVSAGKFDLVEPALEKLGAQFHFTGVRIQPGKPLVFGEIARSHSVLPFFGLPGNPISSAVTFHLFASIVLGALCRSHAAGPRFALAELTEGTKGRGNAGLTRFFPAACNLRPARGRNPHVAAVPWQGSGDLAAFGRSNCCIVVPEGTPGLDAGEVVRILLFQGDNA